MERSKYEYLEILTLSHTSRSCIAEGHSALKQADFTIATTKIYEVEVLLIQMTEIIHKQEVISAEERTLQSMAEECILCIEEMKNCFISYFDYLIYHQNLKKSNTI